MSIASSVKKTAVSGGSRPIMKSVNILVTPAICEKLESDVPDSRSAAVRDAAAVVLEAYAQGYEWIIGEIKERIDATSPRRRREDEAAGVIWEKAIIWIPETMLREIDRLGRPNGIKVSEFLRGVVVYATEDAKN
jgi:hypothetical protein